MASGDEEGTGTAADTATVPVGSTEAPIESSPAPAGPDFTTMVRPPSDMAPIQKQLADIQRAKAATNAANADEAMRRLDQDRARMETAYRASATMPPELQQGWDAKAKMAEHYTDPVTAFGSVGSVFAMLASSFAGLPMEAGLNAGAAAINAVHAGDEKAYQKEYESWKANTDLAIKRHDIQRQAYNDATNLMNSNINAGRTKMELAATRFGDQKAQALLDAGMDKELFELFDSRNKAALATQNQWDKVQLEHEKVQDLRNDPRYQSADPAQKSTAVAEWTQRWSPTGAQKMRYDFQKDYIDARKKEKPDWTPDDLPIWAKEAANAQEPDDANAGGKGGLKSNTPEKLALNTFIEEYKATHDGKGPSADDITAFRQKWKANPNKSGSSSAMRAAEIERRKTEYVQQGMPETQAYNKAAREVTNTTVVASGNRQRDDQSMMDQLDTSLQTIDKVEAALDKYTGIAGLAGAVSRVGERVGNITGISSNTDRQAFEKDIEKLRLTASRLLTLSRGRPLAAEAARINTIVAGKGFGDTGPSTKRAMEDLRALYLKMQADIGRQVDDTWQPPPSTGGPAAAPASGGSGGVSGSKKAPWMNDPIVKPRADLGFENANV